jgi:hypothetical protein
MRPCETKQVFLGDGAVPARWTTGRALGTARIGSQMYNAHAPLYWRFVIAAVMFPLTNANLGSHHEQLAENLPRLRHTD